MRAPALEIWNTEVIPAFNRFMESAAAMNPSQKSELHSVSLLALRDIHPDIDKVMNRLQNAWEALIALGLYPDTTAQDVQRSGLMNALAKARMASPTAQPPSGPPQTA